jgi:hypothetical protein
MANLHLGMRQPDRDELKPSGTPCRTPPNLPFTLLDAIYHIDAGEQSFTALIRGGASDRTAQGTLSGAIIDGWMAGAPVHVQFRTIPTCAGNPAGPCFKGTIQILGKARE